MDYVLAGMLATLMLWGGVSFAEKAIDAYRIFERPNFPTVFFGLMALAGFALFLAFLFTGVAHFARSA